MPTTLDPEQVARMLAQAEEGLRRQGFAESTIKRRRRANRAVIEAHLSREDRQ